MEQVGTRFGQYFYAQGEIHCLAHRHVEPNGMCGLCVLLRTAFGGTLSCVCMALMAGTASICSCMLPYPCGQTWWAQAWLPHAIQGGGQLPGGLPLAARSRLRDHAHDPMARGAAYRGNKPDLLAYMALGLWDASLLRMSLGRRPSAPSSRDAHPYLWAPGAGRQGATVSPALVHAHPGLPGEAGITLEGDNTEVQKENRACSGGVELHPNGKRSRVLARQEFVGGWSLHVPKQSSQLAALCQHCLLPRLLFLLLLSPHGSTMT